MTTLMRLIVFMLCAFGLAQAPQLEVLGQTAEYRLVRHLGGETRVPLTPERIVSLHVIFNEALAALEVVPVAAPFKRPNDIVDRLVPLTVFDAAQLAALQEEVRPFIPAHLPAAFAGAFDLGDGQPNLEVLLDLAPDLIIAHAQRDRESYEQLSRIAPTVLLEFDLEPQALVRDVGLLLGLAELAEARIARYEARLEAARAALAAISQQTIAILKVNRGEIKVKGDAHRAGLVLYRQLGLTPAPMTPLGARDARLSFEVIPQLASDILLLVVDRRGIGETLELLSSPLWQNLPAVQRQQVYLVPNSYWDEAAGITPSERIIDDLLAAFTAEVRR
jgi:iron complex transport system substrate-binding protein